MTILENIEAQLDQREAHIRTKLAQFKKLLRDPEIAPVVQRVLSNGHVRKPSLNGSTRKNSNGIRQAVLALSLPKTFTTVDVLSALEAKHFKFNTKYRKGAVRDALRALVKAEVLNLVRPAEGEQPNVYEFAETKA